MGHIFSQPLLPDWKFQWPGQPVNWFGTRAMGYSVIKPASHQNVITPWNILLISEVMFVIEMEKYLPDVVGTAALVSFVVSILSVISIDNPFSP